MRIPTPSAMATIILLMVATGYYVFGGLSADSGSKVFDDDFPSVTKTNQSTVTVVESDQPITPVEVDIRAGFDMTRFHRIETQTAEGERQ